MAPHFYKLRAIDVDGAYLFHISDADLEGTLDDLGVTPLQRRFLAAKLRGALGRPPPSPVVGRDREVSQAPPPPTGGLGPRTSRMHWGRTTARALHHREDLQRAEATSEEFLAEFRSRVRAAAVQLAAGGSPPGRRAASARVADVLARVGRDAPGALVDEALAARGVAAGAAVDVEALVDLVIVVEERRTAGILESGRRECAELLEVSGGGNTPLIKAGDHADVVELLIARGAPVDAANNDRNTALHLAVGRGDAATATLLCRAGARRDVANAAGVTAARLAEQCGVSLPVEQCGVRLPPDDGPGEPEPVLEPEALEPEPEPPVASPPREPPVASPPRARRPSGTVFAEGELEGFDEADLALMEELTA